MPSEFGISQTFGSHLRLCQESSDTRGDGIKVKMTLLLKGPLFHPSTRVHFSTQTYVPHLLPPEPRRTLEE